jgi:peroxiredoxin
MHEQAQLRRKKEEVEKLGAEAFVVLAMDSYRAKVFKEENLLLSQYSGPFAKEKSLIFATALADPAGRAAAIYGVSRRCVRWGSWVENQPCWFVIGKSGVITFVLQPTFATPTSYEGDIDAVLDELKKAAR